MFSRLAAHDHTCLVYDSPTDLAHVVKSFTEANVEAERLTVFVHSFRTEGEAIAFLAEGGLDVRPLLGKGFFLVSYYRDAFEKGGAIDFDHVRSVVADVLETAGRQGRTGAGLVVDASRVYLDGGRADEWFAFENWLGRRLVAGVGLVCAYRRESVAEPERMSRMLDTHLYRFGG